MHSKIFSKNPKALLIAGRVHSELDVLNEALKNTALGYQTMVKATSASENVVIGNDAGAELTTGSRNVLIGVGQGKLITTQNDILRIGNKPQTAGGSARPLIQGDFATSATTGAAPVPVPPPMPAAMNTKSDPSKAC